MILPERDWYPLASRASNTTDGARTEPTSLLKSPLPGPGKLLKFALAGRVVKMDDKFTVYETGVIYVNSGKIVGIGDKNDAPPDGFGGLKVIETNGTIFPGLIELHNHLSYNALQLWSPVPALYQNRGQWPKHPDYRKLISGPMTVVGEARDKQGRSSLLAPLVRYVECKCILGGVTTSQGIGLSSNTGIRRYYRGILRNVEQTDDQELNDAHASIADIEAKNAAAFRARLNKEKGCFLLHLSEGITPSGSVTSEARNHFLALQISPNEWAINDRFTGIHAVGLLPDDFEILARNGGSMIWSPLSNMLLYGATAHVEAARAFKVRIGIGSDWSPSGSKNLLGELKIAWLYSQHMLNGLFSPRDLIAMATCEAANILGWQAALGSLETGKHADLIVIDGVKGDPYEALITSKETAIKLVMINGTPRYGVPGIMSTFDALGEAIKVGGQDRYLFLDQVDGDPDVEKLSLATATVALTEAFENLPKLAAEIERASMTPAASAFLPIDAPTPVIWSLALDEIHNTGLVQRTRLPFDSPSDFTGPDLQSVTKPVPPLSEILGPIALDPLTVIDDPDFLLRIAGQPNVPAVIRDGITKLY